MRTLKLVLATALLVAPPVVAQNRPITVTGVRGLTFGTVFPGVRRVILKTDPSNSAQFDITGVKNNQLLLTFTLPASMTGPAGATMPLSFGASDAGYSQSQSIGSQVTFDPRTSFIASTLNQQGRGSVFLGGTANPTTNQRAGSYTATITLTVAYYP